MKGLFSCVCLSVALTAAPATAQPQPPAPSAQPAQTSQYWLCTADLPTPQLPELTLVLSFTFDAAAKSWTGTLDVPPAPGVPGAVAVPLKEIQITDTSVRALSPSAGGGNRFELTLPTPGSDLAEGRIIANGVEAYHLHGSRISAAEADSLIVHRPQNPALPLPYREVELAWANPADPTQLGGTLTIPDGPGPFPAVLLVSDFGPHDRNREEWLHRPFLVLADRLTRAGVAVLRSDDRGVGASLNGAYNSAAPELLSGDAMAAIAALRQRTDIDPARIGVIALGEGAPLAAGLAASDQVKPPISFLVLLSPQGLPGSEVLVQRDRRMLEAQGEDAAFRDAWSSARRSALKLIVSGAEESACLAALKNAITTGAASRRGQLGDQTAAQADAAATEQYMTLTLPRVRPWLSADPAERYKAVRCPVLAVAGGLDPLITAADNFPAVERAFRESGNPDVTIRLFPTLNHHLQPAHGFDPAEPVQITTTIAPEALDLIVQWTSSHAKSAH